MFVEEARKLVGELGQGLVEATEFVQEIHESGAKVFVNWFQVATQMYSHELLRVNVLEVRFRFGSTPPNFSYLAGSDSVLTELRERYIHGQWPCIYLHKTKAVGE